MLEEPGFAGIGPRIPLRQMVPVPRLAAAVWLRNARVFSKLWRGALLPTFLDPFLYLLAMGFGLGTYVAHINGIPYKEFIAPGLIA
jgi:lipooligosaccharide transport system permease protein